MKLGWPIPAEPRVFVANCLADKREGRFAKPAGRYLDYLRGVTKEFDAAMYNFVAVVDRERGQERFHADADHIIPKSLWNILMPSELINFNRVTKEPNDEQFPIFSGVVSNLFWRTRDWNRKEDNQSIRECEKEARKARGKLPQTEKDRWIAMLLLTKSDEGVFCIGVPTDPHELDKLVGPSKHSNFNALAATAKKNP